jgi:predicted transcriptional regulator
MTEYNLGRKKRGERMTGLFGNNRFTLFYIGFIILFMVSIFVAILPSIPSTGPDAQNVGSREGPISVQGRGDSNFDFKANCTNPSLECQKGESVMFEFWVQNIDTHENNISIALRSPPCNGLVAIFSQVEVFLGAGENTTFNLLVKVPDTFEANDFTSVSIYEFLVNLTSLEAQKTGLVKERYIRVYLTVQFNSNSFLEDNFVFIALIGIATPVCLTTTLFSVFIFTTEVGRYKFFALAFPLFSRLKKEKILDQFVRGQIYGMIRIKPGVHYSDIKEALGVGNGTLAYHLSVLEREGFIKSSRKGFKKLFNPTKLSPKFNDIDKKFPKGEEGPIEGVKLSALQQTIIDTIKEHPGITESDLVSATKKSKQTINYNIKNLKTYGRIETVKEKNIVKCYIKEPTPDTS